MEHLGSGSEVHIVHVFSLSLHHIHMSSGLEGRKKRPSRRILFSWVLKFGATDWFVATYVIQLLQIAVCSSDFINLAKSLFFSVDFCLNFIDEFSEVAAAVLEADGVA